MEIAGERERQVPEKRKEEGKRKVPRFVSHTKKGVGREGEEESRLEYR